MINTKYNRNSCGAGTISSGYIRLLLLSVLFLLATICFFHYPPVATSREIIGSEFRSLEEGKYKIIHHVFVILTQTIYSNINYIIIMEQ